MSRPKANTPEGREATRKFRETMLKRYGSEEAVKEQYRKIGQKGGTNGRGADYKGGFASNKEKAIEAGRKGGTISRRDKEFDETWSKIVAEATAMYDSGCSIAEIARTYNIPYYKVKYRLDGLKKGKDIDNIEKILNEETKNDRK